VPHQSPSPATMAAATHMGQLCSTSCR
jgi:hypothetical protein